MNGQPFDITVRVTTLSTQPGSGETLCCPVCQSALNIHQPEPDVPHRLLASCSCEECGLWLALIRSPDRPRLYVTRLPVIAELWEAMSRQGLV
jgi:C4-type Zn-finger protein